MRKKYVFLPWTEGNSDHWDTWERKEINDPKISMYIEKSNEKDHLYSLHISTELMRLVDLRGKRVSHEYIMPFRCLSKEVAMIVGDERLEKAYGFEIMGEKWKLML